MRDLEFLFCLENPVCATKQRTEIQTPGGLVESLSTFKFLYSFTFRLQTTQLINPLFYRIVAACITTDCFDFAPKTWQNNFENLVSACLRAKYLGIKMRTRSTIASFPTEPLSQGRVQYSISDILNNSCLIASSAHVPVVVVVVVAAADVVVVVVVAVERESVQF